MKTHIKKIEIVTVYYDERIPGDRTDAMNWLKQGEWTISKQSRDGHIVKTKANRPSMRRRPNDDSKNDQARTSRSRIISKMLQQELRKTGND